MRFGAVILGAGASSRMGSPKLLLPWGQTSILGHLLAQWKRVGATQLAIVCAPPPHPVHNELDRLKRDEAFRIINPDPARGMFSSIQTAARWNGWAPSLTHIAFSLGDQPQIKSATLEGLLDHCREHPGLICQPSLEGRPKHPVLLPIALFEPLANATTNTLRQFLEERPHLRSFYLSEDPGLSIDLDFPADYQAAQNNL